MAKNDVELPWKYRETATREVIGLLSTAASARVARAVQGRTKQDLGASRRPPSIAVQSGNSPLRARPHRQSRAR